MPYIRVATNFFLPYCIEDFMKHTLCTTTTTISTGSRYRQMLEYRRRVRTVGDCRRPHLVWRRQSFFCFILKATRSVPQMALKQLWYKVNFLYRVKVCLWTLSIEFRDFSLFLSPQKIEVQNSQKHESKFVNWILKHLYMIKLCILHTKMMLKVWL